jgi:hypothetical protein
MGFGDFPKRRIESVFTWLNGKIMIALLIEKLMSKKLSPLRTNAKRSVWREAKLLYMLIETGAVSLTALLIKYDHIVEALSVEKRRTRRKLQLDMS